MLKTHNQKRRDFLSRITGTGTLVLLSAATAPVHAAAWVLAGSDPVRGQRPVRLDNVTVENFSALIGETFRLLQEDGSLASVKLIEATALTASGETCRRQPFSIIFDVPRGLGLAQDRYRISHHRLGDMDLFMVPVDLPAKHNRLEAVFA